MNEAKIEANANTYCAHKPSCSGFVNLVDVEYDTVAGPFELAARLAVELESALKSVLFGVQVFEQDPNGRDVQIFSELLCKARSGLNVITI